MNVVLGACVLITVQCRKVTGTNHGVGSQSCMGMFGVINNLYNPPDRSRVSFISLIFLPQGLSDFYRSNPN